MSGSLTKIVVNLLLVHLVTADWVQVSVVRPSVKTTTSSITIEDPTKVYRQSQSKLRFHQEVEYDSGIEGTLFGGTSFGANSSHDIEFNERMLAQIHGFTTRSPPLFEDEHLENQLQTTSMLKAPDQVPEMLSRVHRKLVAENKNTPSSKIEFLRGLRNKILHKISMKTVLYYDKKGTVT